MIKYFCDKCQQEVDVLTKHLHDGFLDTYLCDKCLELFDSKMAKLEERYDKERLKIRGEYLTPEPIEEKVVEPPMYKWIPMSGGGQKLVMTEEYMAYKGIEETGKPKESNSPHLITDSGRNPGR